VERITDDGPHQFLLTVIPYGGDDGSADGWYAWYIDISERKERERAIEELHSTADALTKTEAPETAAEITTEAIQNILDMPANGVHLYDENEDGLVPVAWTDQTEEIVGDPPTFAPGEGIAGTAFETGKPQIYDDISTVAERFNPDTAVRSQICLPLADHGVLVIGSPEPNAFDDTDVSLAETLADHVTTALERIERENELQHQREVFEAVLETSIDGILVIDQDREYVTWNQQFLDMWGVPAELIGDKPEELGLEWALDQLEHPQAFIENVEYLYEHPHEENRDEIHLKDGRVFDRYSGPVEADDGTYFGRVWFFRDITEQKERERELARQNERLEKFTGVVSHDLRNPLSVAEGRIELARDQYDSEHLDSAAQAVERSLTLLEDLLTLAREGEYPGDIESVDLAETCERCWQNVETADAALVIETDRTIRANPGRLKQLLENLFRNAVEHGGEAVTVTVGDLDGGFYVSDDGPGIPGDKYEQVFDAGYSTTDAGTGFGLSIVQEIVEAHEWEISVTESETGGTRIEITSVEIE
jgi:PAS domain S-box-containing protein